MTNQRINVENYLLGLGLLVLAFLLPSAAVPCHAQEAGAPYPVVYSTDLYYTIQDIDDYFDAATLLKMPELDVKAIILDNHEYPTDGEKALDRIMTLSGHKVPVAKGLGWFEMRSLKDQALYVDEQGGVDLILETLRKSNRKVALIAVGSMTDFGVAYLRDPELFMQKIDAVYVVAGSVESPFQDYNVKLDPMAFVVLMRSNLPIVWAPVDSSMWYFPAQQLLVPEKNALAHFLLQELLYWYLRNDWKNNVHKDRYEYYGKGRWMFSPTAFVQAAHDPHAPEMFDLIPCKVDFDDRGVMTKLQLGVASSNIRVVKNVNGKKLNEFIVSQINR